MDDKDKKREEERREETRRRDEQQREADAQLQRDLATATMIAMMAATM